MNNIYLLVNKQCISSKGGVPLLEEIDINRLIIQLNNNWRVNELGHLYKQFNFIDFMQAINFANQIAILSEQDAHHPDLTISWGTCKVEIWTYKINGLTESDFILAAKIETLK